jgi:hypothetical protein
MPCWTKGKIAYLLIEERPLLLALAKHVVAEVRKAGFAKFRTQPEHLNMWRSEDAKNPAKGYGAEVAGTWYWYEPWVKRCIELCKAAGEKYK